MTEAPAFPLLHTPRLTLRALTHADAPAVLAVRGDGPAMGFMGQDPMQSMEDAHDFIAHMQRGPGTTPPYIRWGIARTHDGVLLGTCGLYNFWPPWRKCGVGYELGQAHWGHGYMTEALHAVLPWGFEHWKLHRIEAWIHPDNAASLALAAKLGFQIEGRLREVAFWGGAHHDMLQLAVLDRELRCRNFNASL